MTICSILEAHRALTLSHRVPFKSIRRYYLTSGAKVCGEGGCLDDPGASAKCMCKLAQKGHDKRD